ncbi:Secretory carrier-associated membrane protein 2 [Homalodisca vitripennis]|nr:Secretory carrier-associated membrane protein 2 [Homalodisca vitripennis]
MDLLAPVRGAANPPYQPSSQPAIMQPTQEINPPPSYTKTAQQTQPQQLSAAEFQRRQEELERKAAELARREEELRNAPYNVRRNNWPPLPENNIFGLQPCFYQDINVEIPPEFQGIVRNLYYLWMCEYRAIAYTFPDNIRKARFCSNTQKVSAVGLNMNEE